MGIAVEWLGFTSTMVSTIGVFLCASPTAEVQDTYAPLCLCEKGDREGERVAGAAFLRN